MVPAFHRLSPDRVATDFGIFRVRGRGELPGRNLLLLGDAQFTVDADTRKGRRPSWSAAAGAGVAEPLVDAFVDALRHVGARVETGRFRAAMLVESVNVGPQTLIVEV